MKFEKAVKCKSRFGSICSAVKCLHMEVVQSFALTGEILQVLLQK